MPTTATPRHKTTPDASPPPPLHTTPRSQHTLLRRIQTPPRTHLPHPTLRRQHHHFHFLLIILPLSSNIPHSALDVGCSMLDVRRCGEAALLSP
ncbi:hypothetical protein Ga0100231_018580 [Opitutaceae bacterium TAV4]|nr:hypothetical protein Ga0100231_018580 [Opitutaceae bacterium TAV4]